MKVQFASLVFALVAASWALGQAEVYLANGAVIQGRVTEDDGEKIKVALVAEGGTGATSVYRYDQLAPKTLYRLKFNKTERDDFKGQSRGWHRSGPRRSAASPPCARCRRQ